MGRDALLLLSVFLSVKHMNTGMGRDALFPLSVSLSVKHMRGSDWMAGGGLANLD